METADNKTPKKDQKPAQGAAASDQTILQADISSDTSTFDKTEVPEWALALMESNDKVIASNSAIEAAISNAVSTISKDVEAVVESNTSVINAVADFREAAGDVVKDVLESAGKIAGSGESLSESPVEVDEDARYVVAKGKSFQDKHTKVTFIAGDDVSDFDVDRLQNLLSQKIIELA
jgi:hypothetical protein